MKTSRIWRTKDRETDTDRDTEPLMEGDRSQERKQAPGVGTAVHKKTGKEVLWGFHCTYKILKTFSKD